MPLQVDGLGGQTALTVTPAAITTTETVAHQWKIPANELQAGSWLRLTAHGTISATSAGSIAAKLRAGSLGTIADTQICAVAAAGAATTAVGWWFKGDIIIRTIGSSGTILGNGVTIVQATAAQISAQTATVAINTTIANFLSLTLIGAGTAPSITITQAGIEIVKP